MSYKLPARPLLSIRPLLFIRFLFPIRPLRSTQNLIPTIALLASALLTFTFVHLEKSPSSFVEILNKSDYQRILDSQGKIINLNYNQGLNTTHNLNLDEIPKNLQRLFLLAEDKNYYKHSGVDWVARLSATLQNIKSGRVIRGASTITEQIIRILKPRRRSLWSKYLETIEAYRIESRFSKDEILEFYLNQVPYASNRRGVAQAAEFYFSRDLHTLNLKENLALAVMARSPSRLNPLRNLEILEKKVATLAQQALEHGLIDEAEFRGLSEDGMEVLTPSKLLSPLPLSILLKVKEVGVRLLRPH